MNAATQGHAPEAARLALHMKRMPKFDYVAGAICTADEHGNALINSMAGPLVDRACVDRANMVPQLAEALREAHAYIAADSSDPDAQELLDNISAALSAAGIGGAK